MKRVGHHLELTASEKRSLAASEVEIKRRDQKLIKELRGQIRRLTVAYESVIGEVERELSKAYSAKPGTKYDITAREKKSSGRSK